MEKVFEIGSKSFVLDQDKAEEAYAAKRVINGRETMAFNLLPLKYQWAYDVYRSMKANHWEPEDIPMQKDIEQWQSDTVLNDTERWIISEAFTGRSGTTPLVVVKPTSSDLTTNLREIAAGNSQALRSLIRPIPSDTATFRNALPATPVARSRGSHSSRRVWSRPSTCRKSRSKPSAEAPGRHR